MAALRRGFKTWCEKAADGFRRDLHVARNGPLDPHVLARHLQVLVLTPDQIAGLGQDHRDQLLKHDPSSWSAVTIELPEKKIIILNSSHVPQRQNSDLMHELAHLILEHEPARVDVTPDGLMLLDTYDREQEAEANWFAGALLVPRDALLSVLANNRRNENAAQHFAVSVDMIKWRRQMTGIDLQLRRRNDYL